MGKKKRKNNSNKSRSTNVDAKYTAEDLLIKVDEYLDTFEYDLALKFCEKAMQLEPENLKVIETLACVYAETGEVEESKKHFLKAVELNSEKGHEKYMYLGQMSAGEEAKKWYLKGIEIMKKELETEEKDKDESIASPLAKGPASGKDISNAFCALAEIYMTDCCFEDDAEKQCEKYCKEALESDPKNIDAYIVNANFLLTLERKEEAKKLLADCFEMLKLKGLKAEEGEMESDNETMDDGEEGNKLNDGTIENGAENLMDEAGENEEMIPYTTRVTLAKLLTETGEYEKADIVLSTLVDDDDEDVEVWYMHGWNSYLQGDHNDAVCNLEKAQELYEKLKCDDKELISHVQEILEKCKAILNSSNDGMDVEG